MIKSCIREESISWAALSRLIMVSVTVCVAQILINKSANLLSDNLASRLLNQTPW